MLNHNIVSIAAAFLMYANTAILKLYGMYFACIYEQEQVL